MADETLKNANPPPRRSSLGTAVVLALVAAAGVWFWTSKANERADAGGQSSRIKSTLHLETFVLNLADPDQRSYLRVGIDLGLNKETGRDAVLPVAQVRDVILEVLAQGRVDDLMSPEGKTKLKASLVQALRERIPQLGVEEVYFTEFLIQR
jgi:flagellar basal body-associated protein FliL